MHLININISKAFTFMLDGAGNGSVPSAWHSMSSAQVSKGVTWMFQAGISYKVKTRGETAANTERENKGKCGSNIQVSVKLIEPSQAAG